MGFGVSSTGLPAARRRQGMTTPDSRHLTADERRTLALGAASVFERAALALPAGAPRSDAFTPSDHALGVLRTWIQAFSPGNPEAFERRLTWDDLSLADVARALSSPPAAVLEPEWMVWIDAMIGAAQQAGDERVRGPLPERALYTGDPPPFLDLLVPALRACRDALDATPVGRARGERFGPDALAALDRFLLKSAAGVTELALLAEFRDFLAASKGDYREFTGTLLGEGLVPLFLAYPVLARQLAMIVGRWAANTAELMARLDADREAIADAFNGGADPGRVDGLEPALSDPHHGGRRVAALRFASGLRVVYKPRSLALDRAFGDLLAWLEARGLAPAQRALRVIDRGEYGWVEYVDQEPFASAAEVAGYYRRAGGLLCIAHVLRARDLHMENVVATRGGPVLIDLELTLQPVPRTAQSNAPHRTRTADVEGDAVESESCLTSGFLTLVESGAGQAFDIGGLRGTGEGIGALAGRVWRGLETDAVHFTEEKTFTTRVRNQVVLDGAAQAPDAYAADLLAGFDETYAFLLAHRDALLAPGGPLAAFAAVPVRLLPRPTTQYASLNYLLARPQYQKDGCRWSAAIDALNRAVSQAHDQPEVWPVLVAERKAIEALDIPHFTVLADETAVRSGTRVVLDGYYAQSGLASVRDRIAGLSVQDAAAQHERVRLALSESIHTRFSTEPEHAPDVELDVTSPDFLVDHAVWIARELLARAERTVTGLHWPRRTSGTAASRRHHLYDGSLGPAVFLAAVAAVTGDERWRTAATEVVGACEADLARIEIERDDIGVASGLGSIVYALTMIGALLGDDRSLGLARRVAKVITIQRISEDAALDLVGGAAGAALGLLALHRLAPQQTLLDHAVACGDHLIGTGRSLEGGTAWRTADGRIFTGFAHGAAGIAYALGRLHDATGERRFRRAATDGYRYVASRFLSGVGNWPILGEPAEGVPVQGPTMTAWCHGAPGIALSIALGSADAVDPRLLDQLEPALATTAAASPHKADHLCCGSAGRCESLFTAGRRLMRREAFEGARRLARIVIARARKAGHFCLTSNGFEYRIFDAGFFRGISGIGYVLLRLAAPSDLPSLAAFEAPPGAPPRELEKR